MSQWIIFEIYLFQNWVEYSLWVEVELLLLFFAISTHYMSVRYIIYWRPLIMKKEQKVPITSMDMPSIYFCIQNVRCLLKYMYKWHKTQRYQLIITEYLFGFGVVGFFFVWGGGLLLFFFGGGWSLFFFGGGGCVLFFFPILID